VERGGVAEGLLGQERGVESRGWGEGQGKEVRAGGKVFV